MYLTLRMETGDSLQQRIRLGALGPQAFVSVGEFTVTCDDPAQLDALAAQFAEAARDLRASLADHDESKVAA